jgi:hypothetical protein
MGLSIVRRYRWVRKGHQDSHYGYVSTMVGSIVHVVGFYETKIQVQWSVQRSVVVLLQMRGADLSGVLKAGKGRSKPRGYRASLG